MSHYSYNRSVTKEARRQFITWSLVVVGWFAAPIVKAYLDGTPLHGLPGILRFWKLLALSSIPVWAVVGIVGGSFAVFLGCARRKRMSHDHDLRVVVSEMPQPQWGIGAIANVPCLNLHLEARLSHRSEESLEIVKAYLQGTEPTGPFLPIVVAAPSGGRGVIHLCNASYFEGRSGTQTESNPDRPVMETNIGRRPLGSGLRKLTPSEAAAIQLTAWFAANLFR
jgi:hypothetical protein